MGMHRVWDFTDEVGPLTEEEARELSRALHSHAVERLTGVITDVGADTFTVLEPDGRSSTWPMQGWMSGYRRGLLCSIVLGPGEIIGVGDAASLRYITVPDVTEVWIESRGAVL